MSPRRPTHLAAPIPYGSNYGGPCRQLTLTLRRGLLGSPGAYVSIDGWTRVLPWGTAILEVPADRPVMISVHQTWMAGLATTTLMPHDPPVLEYRSPRAATFPGELGAPGTTRARGAGWLLALLVAAPVLAVTPVLLAIVFLLLQ